ncbi:hypothetical protein ACTMU2_23320 [Cupriavidus basilensis]
MSEGRFREAMELRDADSAPLRLSLDEERSSSHLRHVPDGQRLIGHEHPAPRRFSQLLEEQPVLIDVIETGSHASLGVSIFDGRGTALRRGPGRADLYVHTTYVLMQDHEGWRLAYPLQPSQCRCRWPPWPRRGTRPCTERSHGPRAMRTAVRFRKPA